MAKVIRTTKVGGVLVYRCPYCQHLVWEKEHGPCGPHQVRKPQ